MCGRDEWAELDVEEEFKFVSFFFKETLTFSPIKGGGALEVVSWVLMRFTVGNSFSFGHSYE